MGSIWDLYILTKEHKVVPHFMLQLLMQEREISLELLKKFKQLNEL